MEAFMWMLYSYSNLILSLFSLMASLFGPETIELIDDNLSSFFSISFLFIFIFLLCWFFFFQNLFMAILYIATQLLSIFLNKDQWPRNRVFVLFICSFSPIPYFNLVHKNFIKFRESPLFKPNHIRYFNMFGASLNMILGIGLFYYQKDKSSLWSVMFFIFLSQSLLGVLVLLETKMDFGLYDSAIQNAMGHALGSFGWTRRTKFVFAICTVLACGRFLLESHQVSGSSNAKDQGILQSESNHRDEDLENKVTIPAEA